jgi:hypothetical protein
LFKKSIDDPKWRVRAEAYKSMMAIASKFHVKKNNLFLSRKKRESVRIFLVKILNESFEFIIFINYFKIYFFFPSHK